VAYAVVSWLLIQVATQVFPFFEIPNWAVEMVVVALVIGFPIALVLSWAFELTPEGIKRENEVDRKVARKTGRKLTAVVVVVAAAATGLMLFRLLHSQQAIEQGKQAPPTTEIDRKSIAVLPFENLSDDRSNAYFTDGVQDEILTRLAKIADLRSSRALRPSTIRARLRICRRSPGNLALPTFWKAACRRVLTPCA